MNQLQEKQHFIEEDEIDLLDILKTILSYKKLLVIVTLIMTILATVGGYFYNRSKVVSSVVLSLNYPGVTEGKNPDGTNFNVRELISNNVLEKVFEDNKNEIKEKNIFSFGNSFQILPILPAEIKVKLENAKKAGEIFKYFPTRYEISTKNKPIILDKVINSTIIDFIDEYRPKVSISYIDNINDYDYPEKEIILNNKLNELKNIAENQNLKNFISSKLGYSFNQILSRIKIIQDIELKSLESYIQVNGLTADENLRTVIYESQIRELNLEKNGLISKAETVKQMLQDYKITGKAYVIPNIGEVQGKINISNDYYSNLIGEYLSINNKIADIDVSIYKLENLKKNIKISTSEEKIELSGKFNTIVEQINNLIKHVNIMIDEYTQKKYSEMIKTVAPVIRINQGKPLMLFVVVGVVLGLALSFLFIFIAEVRKEYLKK